MRGSFRWLTLPHFWHFIVFSLKLCLENGLKYDPINNGNLFWIIAKELAVVGHLRAPVADVANSAFQSGLKFNMF